jgi:hypothetical protein
MALLFLDGCDHYATGDVTDKYLSGSASIVAGRHGNGRSLQACRLALTPAPTHRRCVIGGAYKFVTAYNQLYVIWDGGANFLYVETTIDGGVRVYLWYGTGPEHQAQSAADLVHVGQWHYLEVDLEIDSIKPGSYTQYGLSACRVLLDGSAIIDTTLDFTTGIGFAGNASAAKWTQLDIGDGNGVLDDFYVCDGAGSGIWTAPVGDIRIGVIRPNGTGATTGWTPSGAASNWDAVNDTTPDDDTTTVTAGAAGLSDLYAMEDVSTGDTILGAQILVNAKRTAEGFATLTPLLRHAGVTTALTPRPLASSYFYRNRECFETMPNGDPLTDANVNALQAGIRRDA